MDLSKEFHPVPKNKRIINKKLLKEKNGFCELCGKPGQTEKHHIKTKGSGGNDTKENLIEVCRICHTKIHTGEIELLVNELEILGKSKNELPFEIISSKNTKDIIHSYGKLKGIEIEQQVSQDWGCANFLVNYNTAQTSISIYGMNAMFYSMTRVNQLRCNYEKENKIKYDYVICLRPDILLNRELDINSLLSTQAPEDIDKAIFTMANPFATVLKGFESYGITDCFFFGRPNVVDKVLSNLPKVKEVFHPNIIYRNGPEYEFIKTIKALNYIPYRIDFKYGEDIDILRNPPTEKLRKKVIKFHIFKKKKFLLCIIILKTILLTPWQVAEINIYL